MPIKNKNIIDKESSDIVRGSVEGVITADNMADEITTILQFESIFPVVIIPKEPNINCKTGSWKATAVLDINKSTKSKYLSIDQIGSTMSAPNFIKKFIAAGTSIHQENNNPKKNNIPEPKTVGNKSSLSLFVSPGEINKII